MNIVAALDKLNKILPLKKRQSQLTSELKKQHQDILFSLAKLGKVTDEYDCETLKLLNDNDLIVLSQDKDEIRGAYPFSLNKTKHKLFLENADIYAMCAFDAVAIAPVFNIKTKIISKCHITNEKIEIQQNGNKLDKVFPSKNIHIGIKWQETGACAADSLCMEMVFLLNKEIASDWNLSGDKSVFSIDDAIKFSIKYFGPLVN